MPLNSQSSFPEPNLSGCKIVLAVTGGIAAFRAVDLCSRLLKAGAQVRVTMTPSATKFIAPLTFEAISGAPATTDLFARDRAWEMDHIADARWADLVVVAPATADILAKMAHGIADCPVSTLVLAYEGPLLAAPAMNSAMYLHPATQENLAVLSKRGVEIVGPAEGRLACGEVGPGRLADVDDIFQAIARRLARGASMSGKTVLVTAGPTREFMDPVRFVSNPSSGRMGYALAQEAARRGARAILISGPSALAPPPGVECQRVTTTAEMLTAVKARFVQCDMALFAAAPADYRPAHRSEKKEKKSAQEKSLELEPTEDIAAWAGQNRTPGQTLVLFAAETHDGEARALEKLRSKKHDYVVLNDVLRTDIGFASEENEVLILGRRGKRRAVPKQPKARVAAEILDFVAGKGPPGKARETRKRRSKRR